MCQVARLLAKGMNLPEDTFAKLHNFDGVGETYSACAHSVQGPLSRPCKLTDCQLNYSAILKVVRVALMTAGRVSDFDPEAIRGPKRKR